MADRIYGNTVIMQLHGEGTDTDTGLPGGNGPAAGNQAGVVPQMAQVDRFTWRWRPVIERYWPSGTTKQQHSYQDGTIEVTLEGGQVDMGFAGIVEKQRAILKGGGQPPKLHMIRTAYGANKTPLFTQRFGGGVVIEGSGDQGGGNAQLKNTLMIEFDDMHTKPGLQ